MDQRVWSLLPAPLAAAATLDGLLDGDAGPFTARGAGMSYGDTAIAPGGKLVLGGGGDWLSDFDDERGLVSAGGGTRLETLLRVCWQKGMTLPVLPGTARLTVGGAIASDVHGKNHHEEGSFGAHVRSLSLWRPSEGRVLDLSEGDPLFAATLGGMGLTGVITGAVLSLKPLPTPWMVVTETTFDTWDEYFRMDAEFSATFEHTAAWIDSTSADGRGVFLRGRAATPWEAAGMEPKADMSGMRVSWPLRQDFSLVGKVGTKVFNTAFRLKPRGGGEFLAHAGKWLFPLDAVEGWNWFYGSRGFYQYQCRLPRREAPRALKEMLSVLVKRGEASCLSVLKTMGRRKTGAFMTFAEEGVSFAMDFPNKGASTLAMLSELDSVVKASGPGAALYPCKDGRMPPEMFELSFPEWREWWKWRDPKMDSAFARRCMHPLLGEKT